jgi:type VI protein secretion system component VasA
MEYFISPQKFLFIDVPFSPGVLNDFQGNEFSLLFALEINYNPEKWPLPPHFMRLGSIPVVNLSFKTVDHKKNNNVGYLIIEGKKL